jgi:tellurite resistance protein TerB
MGIFGKVFKSAKKVQNQNLMEAIVAGSMLLAAADGEIGKAERDKLDKLLTSNDNLSAFKPAEIRKVIQRYENILDADFDVGQNKMMKELADISDNSENCEEVFLNALAIAKADGDISDKEKDILRKIARNLGISNLAEFNI